MWGDLVKAARVLRRSPVFALTVILTMAIGIGANAALFSLASTLYFTPLPVKDPDRLVVLYRGDTAPTSNVFSYPLYKDVQTSATSFEDVVAFSNIEVLVGAGEGLVPVPAEIVSGNYFNVLGVSTTLGRPLLPEDDKTPGAHAVAVVSTGFWREHFGANRDAIGRTVLLNHRPYTIVGVVPPNFAGTILGSGTQIWVPMAMQMQMRPPSSGAALAQGLDLLSRRGNGWLSAAARLREGVEIDTARAELQLIAKRLEAQYPQNYRDYSFGISPIAEQSGLRQSSRTLITVLFSVVGLVLLVACTNVASLIIARTAERWQEISVRLALGASRRRLMWQLVSEYVVLAICGGVAGLLIAHGGTSLLRAWAVPPTLDLPLDWRVMVFTMVLVAITGLLMSIWPAVSAARSDMNDGLRGGRTATPHRAFARQALVSVQLAVALVLVISAGLALRTLWNVSRIEPGFSVDRVTAIPLDIRTLGLTLATAQPIYERARVTAAEVPGVEAASLARVVPLSGGGRSGAVVRPGADPSDQENLVGTGINVVTPGFFDTLRVPIREGRDFESSDTATSERVVVISRALARELWPTASAVGQQISLSSTQRARVVGVVEDARYRSPREAPGRSLFYPVTQQPELGMTILVRTNGEVAGSVEMLIQRLREMEPRLPLQGVRTLDDLFGTQTRTDRMFAWTIGALASVAVALAAMGIYGVVAFLVNQRRREVGLRLALGATSSNVLLLILRQHVVVVAIGLTIGLGLSAGLGRMLRVRLFEVAALDTSTYVVSVVAMLVAAGLAAWLPARRALATDPVAVLRAE